MNIKAVKTAIKIGDFALRQNHRNKISLVWLPSVNRSVLIENSPRVYLFVEDGIIKKIGRSFSKGGIRSTMSFYTSAMTGSPGMVRFVIHLLIEDALLKRSKVELFMITSPKVLARVNGLFGHKEIKISSSYEMENLCMTEYYSREGKYPDWNFKENNTSYPPELAIKHVQYHQNRLNRAKGAEV